jgi:hypothetical protein
MSKKKLEEITKFYSDHVAKKTLTPEEAEAAKRMELEGDALDDEAYVAGETARNKALKRDSDASSAENAAWFKKQGIKKK